MGKRHCMHTGSHVTNYAADGSWIKRCCACGQQLAAGGADSHPNPPDPHEDAAWDEVFSVY